MSAKGNPEAQLAASHKTIFIDGPNLFEKPAELKRVGGSRSDDWNHEILDQTAKSLWTTFATDEQKTTQYKALTSAFFEINANDPLEGMIAAQLLAGHHASMECFRRAMLPDQSFEGRRENLTQANKLSRTFTLLLDSLNKHRGKGQQKVTVEHVHVYEGGQAIVGQVAALGGGASRKIEDQPHAQQIANGPELSMRGANTERQPVPVAQNAERPLPLARRAFTRRAKGK